LPPEIENAEELETSTVQDEADASQEVEQSASAQSSGAEDVSETAEEGTLSIVRDVVSKTEAAPVAAASSASEVNGQETGEDKPTTEPDNENFSDVPFNKHPRFQQVLGKLKAAETDAQRYRNVETFIGEQGLTGDEAAELLQIGGLIKTNPVEAWKRVLPTIQQLAIAAGEVLPEDLRQRVQAGEVSREVAMDLSRQRAANQSLTARQNWERENFQQRQVVELQQQIGSTVNSWESERRARDPNFEAKLPAIEREVAWLQSKEGKPRDVNGVRDQLQRAYTAVSASFAAPVQSAPKPATKRPVTGGQVNGNVRPEPTSTLDIIEQVVAARRAG
jgi:hypothetical protein